MQLDLNQFNLADLMGALGAAEGAMQEHVDDPALPGMFRSSAQAWLEQITKLSAAIAKAHNDEMGA